jgi:four helix bundle protein
MFNFERLDVWQKAIDFADLVYARSDSFPDSERFGLTAQIRRSAASIPANIAEGAARPAADFAKFLGYASGSLYEVVTHSTIAHRRRYLGHEYHREIYFQAEEIARMLSGLRSSLKS